VPRVPTTVTATTVDRQRRVQGVITIVQESRFRLQDAEGRGYLFTLRAGLHASRLRRYEQQRTPVTVLYTGQVNTGAIARTVKPTSTTLVG
jgi:hypothetical protein